jgi:hypothetical protein
MNSHETVRGRDLKFGACDDRVPRVYVMAEPFAAQSSAQ